MIAPISPPLNFLSISGLGPHGERASPPQQVNPSTADIQVARGKGLRVAVLVHTLDSDWVQQQLRGIAATLGECNAAIVEVVDCHFSPEEQIAALDRLVTENLNAIISLPVANNIVADAHSRVAKAGISLILIENVPTGLLPGKDYASLISADNFGLGLIAAELLSPHLAPEAEVGVLGFDANFFATDEREIAFGQWLRHQRPDLTAHVARFDSLESVAETTVSLFASFPNTTGLFIVWDVPALKADFALKKVGLTVPIATVDLSRETAISLAQGSSVIGVAAQQPYLQGVAAAQTAVLSMLGQSIPAWIALPGLSVTSANVIESFQTVWQVPAPKEILDGLKRIEPI